jgi:tagatose 1,6-diphosphate aldolase GatY/KbaY
MPLSLPIEVLVAARARRQAIAAFSVYNLEQIRGVLRAGQRQAAPIIVMAGSSAFRYAGQAELMALATAAAAASSAPAGVHLDHAESIEEIAACLDAGYTSVMLDRSPLAFEENVRETRAAARLAHDHGAWIEGELAGVAGAEDASEAVAAGALTDPDLAARFVAATGVDALAVSVGNVHGMAAAAPARLDLERLAEIASRVAVPLVLHGASGLPADQVRAAIRLGVAKLNVNTELRRAFRGALRDVLEHEPPGDDLASVLTPATDAVAATAEAKIRDFRSATTEG